MSISLRKNFFPSSSSSSFGIEGKKEKNFWKFSLTIFNKSQHEEVKFFLWNGHWLSDVRVIAKSFLNFFPDAIKILKTLLKNVPQNEAVIIQDECRNLLFFNCPQFLLRSPTTSSRHWIKRRRIMWLTCFCFNLTHVFMSQKWQHCLTPFSLFFPCPRRKC